MAKVRFTSSTKIGKLGKLQEPIVKGVKKDLPGAKVAPVPLPNGLAGLFVEWDGFSGHDVSERQRLVRDAIARVDRRAPGLISMIMTLTRDEAADIEESQA